MSNAPLRIAILGNSGSGKTTLARWLGDRASVPVLDLDTVAWEPDRIAVARAPEAAEEDVRRFCRGTSSWVVEGCYANLVEAALAFRPRLLLLDPGEARCIAHCRSRPWEPHKYASKAEQDERLESLLDWVRDYYVRDGPMSRAGHLRCFDAYDGPKEHAKEVPELGTFSAEAARWLGGSGCEPAT